jgi:hypothetical protein
MILKLYLTSELETDIKKDLILNSNNDNILNIYFYDEDDLLVSIEGATLYFTVKENATDDESSAVLVKEITDIPDAANGYAQIVIEKDDCELLVGNYLYEIAIQLDSMYYTLLQGNICFKKTIVDF